MSYVKEVLEILLGSLYFAKLSFSEVAGYSLFFLYGEEAKVNVFVLKADICFVGSFLGKRNTVYPGFRVFIYCSIYARTNFCQVGSVYVYDFSGYFQ